MTTKYVYEFGKRWNAKLPRQSIKWILGRVHVGTPEDDIAADIRRRCAQCKGFTETLIRRCIAYALCCHRENQEFYRDVMRGTV